MHRYLETLNEDVKHFVDAASIGTTLLALLEIIPHVTAVLSLIWVCIRLYETKTVQRWIK